MLARDPLPGPESPENYRALGAGLGLPSSGLQGSLPPSPRAPGERGEPLAAECSGRTPGAIREEGWAEGGGRIHFGDTQGRVLGQAVKQEPRDVEERLGKVEAERLLLQRGKHTEPNFSAEPLLGRVRGRRWELGATATEERLPRKHLPCVRGSLRPHLHDPQPKLVREAPLPSLQ